MVDVQAQDHLTINAEKTAERVLAAHKLVQPDAAAVKGAGTGGFVGRALCALFRLVQRKVPTVTWGATMLWRFYGLS